MLRDLPPEQRIEAELRFLSQAGEVLASSLDYETTLQTLATLAVPKLADWCAVDMLDEKGALVRLTVAHSKPENIEVAKELARRWPPRPDQPGGAWDVIRTRKSVLVENMTLEQLDSVMTDPEQRPYLEALKFHSWIMAPLLINDRVLGVMTYVQAESPRRFDDEDVAFIEELARRAAIHVENSRLFRESQRQRQTLEILNRVGAAIGAELDHERLVKLVTEAATRLTGAERGVYVSSEQAPLTVGHALFKHTFDGLGVVRLDDVTRDPRYPQSASFFVESEDEPAVRSYLAVPILSRSGEVFGGLFFSHHEIGVFTQQSEDLLLGLAAQASTAMDNARLFGKANTLIRELERANRQLDQFAYATSHDLKAPLRGISTLTEMLEDDVGSQLPPSAREQLSLIRGRVRMMENLIKGIFELSRAGATTGAEEVDVHELLREALGLLPGSQHVALPKEKLPTIRTARANLEQVFLNLISNAIKHGDSNAPRVVISAREQGDRFEFAVQDNGPGIEPNYHERIFDIFQTLGKKSEQNTGIGLAIVKRIVDAHNGRVWVESVPGQGATFKFTWPRDESGR